MTGVGERQRMTRLRQIEKLSLKQKMNLQR